ncbi:MAG: hypothetical protein JWL77_535 [Chthonomonadaceae bacterium]|nr:hypothetical protein [Chthonomonadaceae bacterium]
MPLFPQEPSTALNGGPDASQRMFWTREGGTRRLVFAFLGLILIWFLVDRVRDHFLLERQWKPLTADLSGLTVVGTLDSRGSYDRNMFRVVQANKEFRVELTDFGWRSIFDPKNGPMYSEQAGNAIKGAIDLDDLTGSAMLEPYLASGIAHLQGKPDWKSKVASNMPIVIEGAQPGHPVSKGTLGALISHYSQHGPDQQNAEVSEGGSGTTHEVEHGMTIPGDTLAKVCPVVLTGAEFNGAYVEESPASLVGGRTWTLHLGLTPEGRSRFYQWSHDHINENLVFILNHEVLAAGRVSETLDVNEWGVGPLHDEGAIRKLEAYVRSRIR